MPDTLPPGDNVDRYPGDDIPYQEAQQKQQNSYLQQPLHHIQAVQPLSEPVMVQPDGLSGCLRTVIFVSLLLLVLVIIAIIIGALGR